ncbi:hypothetical protein TrRE_jg3097 [Triparma retinervis]|uniref:Uncharacterized protein n=1 Tax=Triparma retinervis TaxID=2557542 RepID=A0A9W7A4A7_9STRA|nr:hypothetical protein TrRE_jg3097 [Triparma retinervis]
MCPEGYSGVDLWYKANDCHAHDEFLRIIHVVNLLLYCSCTAVALLGCKLSWEKDAEAYLKKAKSKMAGVQKSPKANSKKVVPSSTTTLSTNSEQDEETGQARKRTSSMDMQGLTRWEVHKKMLDNNKEGKYFKLSKLFLFYVCFGVLGSIYLVLAVSGVYHSNGSGVHDISKGIASGSFFAGLWQVVLIWHGAIPKSLFKGSENNPLHNPAFVRKLVVAHQCFFFLWFFVCEFIFPVAGQQFLGDRMTTFGMGLCITNFTIVMVLITEDVRKMLQGAMETTRDEGTKSVYKNAEFKRKLTFWGVLLIAPQAAIFCYLLALAPVFFPDGSVWYTLCGASATMWVNLVFLVYYGSAMKKKLIMK